MYINKNQVLRYLGYKNQKISTTLNLLIDTCINEAMQYIQERYVIKFFDIQKNPEDITVLESTLIFKGKDIVKHLQNSNTCVIMAATLGYDIENKIKLYSKTNLTKAVILDACATTAIENLCNRIENKIKKEAEKKDLKITYRYSPGYGDFSIDIQPLILSTLETQKTIGLTCTEEKILIPRKSVTAIIGFIENIITPKHPSCKKCSKYKDCIYKRKENSCGN